MLRVSCPVLLVIVILTIVFAEKSFAADQADRVNVLFIAIDDLRPLLGCYGDQIAVTPNIDRLASRGMVFNRAYCQEAVCSPSRLSLLTGRRPDTIHVWDLKAHFRDTDPNLITLPQHFQNHGYHTQSLGKVYHGSGRPSKDPPSWSVEPKFDVVRDENVRYALPRNLHGDGLKRAASESADVPDNTYIDGIVCDKAIETLRDLKKSEIPFFLAVGFRKPHLPFCAPERYWRMYGRDKIPRPATDEHPTGAPEWATRSWMELEGYNDIPEDGQLTKAKVQELRHGYYACVSYVDSLVGRILEELDILKLSSRTVVVLWGDHGFHLGEQNLWTKANNYEMATRVPLIISVPKLSGSGRSTDALVELVDLYPTLADVCGLDVPENLEGVSLKPLLLDSKKSWKRAVFSQYPRDRTSHRHRGPGDVMGYAVRTTRFRYVEWKDWRSKSVLARELYDIDLDPHEMLNVADHENYQDTLKELAAVLEAGWRSVTPENVLKQPESHVNR